MSAQIPDDLQGEYDKWASSTHVLQYEAYLICRLIKRIAALTERAEQAEELTRSVKRTYDLNLRTLEENYEIQMREDNRVHDLDLRKLKENYESQAQEILDANDRIITLTVERDTWRSRAERAVEWKPTTPKSLPKIGDSVIFNVPSCYGVEEGMYCEKGFLCNRTSLSGDEIYFSIEEVDMWISLPMPTTGGKKEK